jgi:sulfur carrier protein ThiS
MAKVFFPDHLMQHTSGVRELEVNAASFRDLVAQLELRFPGISQVLIGKVAVAIDGDIIHDPFLDPVRPDSEVYFLHRIEGG